MALNLNHRILLPSKPDLTGSPRPAIREARTHHVAYRTRASRTPAHGLRLARLGPTSATAACQIRFSGHAGAKALLNRSSTRMSTKPWLLL